MRLSLSGCGKWMLFFGLVAAACGHAQVPHELSASQAQPASLSWSEIISALQKSDTRLVYDRHEITSFFGSRKTLLGFDMLALKKVVNDLEAIYPIKNFSVNTDGHLLTAELQTVHEVEQADGSKLSIGPKLVVTAFEYDDEHFLLGLKGMRRNGVDVTAISMLRDEATVLKLADGTEEEFDLEGTMAFYEGHESEFKSISGMWSKGPVSSRVMADDLAQTMDWFRRGRAQNQIHIPKTLVKYFMGQDPKLAAQAKQWGMHEVLAGMSEFRWLPFGIQLKQDARNGAMVNLPSSEYPLSVASQVRLLSSSAQSVNLEGLHVVFDGPLQTRFFPVTNAWLSGGALCMNAHVKIFKRFRGRSRSECVDL